MIEENFNNELDLINLFFQKSTSYHLPHAELYPSNINGWGGRLNYKNAFKETKFEINPKSTFLHFTSLQGLEAILNSGYLRMTELSNLSDKSELEFGTDIFNEPIISSDNLKRSILAFKESIFELSSVLSNPASICDAYMWSTYGNNEQGAAIEFELTSCTTDFILVGKVCYGNDSLDFRNYLKETSVNFKQEYGIIPENIVSCFIEIFAFLKKEEFRKENEIRILVRRDKLKHEIHDYPFIYQSTTPTNQIKHFFKLILVERKDVLTKKSYNGLKKNKWFHAYPRVRIKRIILGSKLSPEQKVEIGQFLTKIKENFKYSYEVFTLDYCLNELKCK